MNLPKGERTNMLADGLVVSFAGCPNSQETPVEPRSFEVMYQSGKQSERLCYDFKPKPGSTSK